MPNFSELRSTWNFVKSARDDFNHGVRMAGERHNGPVFKTFTVLNALCQVPLAIIRSPFAIIKDIIDSAKVSNIVSEIKKNNPGAPAVVQTASSASNDTQPDAHRQDHGSVAMPVHHLPDSPRIHAASGAGQGASDAERRDVGAEPPPGARL